MNLESPESPVPDEQAVREFVTLLSQARRGDNESLVELLTRVTPALRRSISIAPVWRGTFDEDDVLQVTCMEAFLRLDQFVGLRPGAFLAWLRTIARNNVRAAIRGLQCDKRPNPGRRLVVASGTDGPYGDLLHDLGTASGTPSRMFARAEVEELLGHAMDRLPLEYALVIRLYYFEGLSGESLSRKLGRSRGASLMLLCRARERLAEMLGSSSRFFSDSP